MLTGATREREGTEAEEQANCAAYNGTARGRRTIIEPPGRGISLDLGELWRYRDLLTLLVWRDISANYRQSVIGYGWAVLRPAISAAIFTLIFGRVAGLPSDGSPYLIFSFCALLPWMYFAGALTASTASVVTSSALLTKVYFPRLLLPLAPAVTGLVDLGIQFLVLLTLMACYGVAPGWSITTVPLFVLAAAVCAISVGLWLTALNVKYRDVGHTVPFLVQAWMWMTPIVYSSNMIPDGWRSLYGLNPMVGVVEGFRWALLGANASIGLLTLVSALAVLAMGIGGLYYFRRMESSFMDVI